MNKFRIRCSLFFLSNEAACNLKYLQIPIFNIYKKFIVRVTVQISEGLTE